MRVLFLSNEPWYRPAGTAYAYRLEALRAALEAQGVETATLSLRDEPYPRPLLAHPLNTRGLRDRVCGYDFIHAGGDAAYTAAFLRRHTDAKVVHDVHGDTLSESQLKWRSDHSLDNMRILCQARVVNAIAYRFADYFLVVSNPLRRRLVMEKAIAPDRIGLIRNGVDLNLFEDTSHVTPDEFVAVYAGGLQPWQALETLVKAVELLPRGRVWLRMIGFTAADQALRDRIQTHLGERVELLDRVAQDQLLPHLRSASVLLCQRVQHRATEVMFPCKFSEFLALGKPVVVCNVDETAAMVEEHDCGFVARSTPESLATAIRTASNTSPVRLAQLGRNARRLAERTFSWDDIGRRYAAMLHHWKARECTQNAVA